MTVEEVSKDEMFVEVDIGPHPIHIVEVNDDHSFKLNEEGITSILMQEDVVDMPVVVVSVAGAFRKGKSFILNFFLRYLSHLENDSWLGDPDANLDGFSWRGGSDRDTTGILMWSEVFKVDIPSGENVAVVLMDTQGAFDSSSTVKDCATIFALSTMTSSVQIYNISQNLQEDDLQHLELFTEYGRLAMEDSDFKPFQMLQFLIRDWSFPYEYPYGHEGGMKFLETRLKLTERPEELQRVRKHIQSCFTELSCFLMPHPGLSVATNPHFKGALKDITSEFKEQVTLLAPLILSPDGLQTKKINGAPITCGELVEYFRAYMKIYDGENLPEPKTMLQATAEANNLAAVAKSKDVYNSAMEKVCGSSCGFVNPKLLEKEHASSHEAALECFDTTRKMGGDSFSAEYREKLESAIVEMYENFTKTNDSKNVFKNFRTPAVFLSLALLNYLLSGMFGFVYLSSLASLCNLFLLASFVALVLWGYVSYVGQYNDVNQTLDLCADFFWLLFMAKIYESAMNEGAKQLSKGALNNLMKDSSGDREKKTQ